MVGKRLGPLLGVAALMAAASCSSSHHPSAVATTSSVAATTTTASPKSGSGPCGLVTSPPRYQHVIWVWMENHSYGDIVGSSQAPYINQLLGHCGLATNYHNVTHPSLPNYIAATSGLPLSGLTQFSSDCDPSPTCRTTAPSIFGQGETWRSYEQSMPQRCGQVSAGEYAAKHNPALYYGLPTCQADDEDYPNLAVDVASGVLPAFSFVTPNVLDDMHSGTVAEGDGWLASNLPMIFSSSEYRAGTVAVFITWDEGEGGTSDDCAANTTDVGCHTAALVISPSTVPGTKSAVLFNHYSLLGTAEQLLGSPKLDLAASYPTMVSAFNL